MLDGNALGKLSGDLSRLGIDFEKSSPFAEWNFQQVVFPATAKDVTIRHRIEGKGQIVVIPVRWELATDPGTAPALYVLSGTPTQPGYVKVRSTVVGTATVLVALRRDSD